MRNSPFGDRNRSATEAAAEEQAGYFTTAQATEAGVSSRTLYQRTRGGDIDHIPLRADCYRLRRFPAHPFEDVAAACQWAGGDPHHRAPPVPWPSARRRHHHADLSDADRTRVHAVPVTTIARTLQDVGATSDPALVEQAVAQAIT